MPEQTSKKTISDEEAVKTILEVDEGRKNGDSSTARELTREAILQQTYVPKVVRVDVPEWGGHVFVRELTGRQRDQFEVSQLEGKGTNQRVNLINLRAKLVAYAVVNSKGERVFEETDARQLGNKSAKALTRVYRVAAELSGLTSEDEDDLTGPLEKDQNEDSGSN